MKVYELVNKYDPVLHKKCEEFNFEKGYNGLSANEIYEILRDSMCHHRGVGLSACQLGIDARVFVMGNPDDPASVIPIFNPKIVNIGDKIVTVEEGCLSFPGLFIKMKRPHEVRMRFADINGKVDTASFTGMTARIALHEYDHLEGIVFTKIARRLDLDKAYMQQKKLNRARKRNENLSAGSFIELRSN